MVDTYKTLGKLIAERLMHTQSREQRSQSMRTFGRSERQKTSTKRFQGTLSPREKAEASAKTTRDLGQRSSTSI
jgi:hypothetical protein